VPIAPLANAELSVMELLWDHGAMTARQVQDRLYGAADRSQHGTVQRLLQRLEEKGFVRRDPRRDRATPANTFAPSLSRAEYAGGSIAPLLSNLIDRKRLSRAELQRLRELLDGRHP
jgi:predicted transcriptional regulator